MNSMTTARKIKISISLDAELLNVVDRLAAGEGATRSAFMERCLRQASHRAKVTRLEEETAAYYDALTEGERQDDASWAAASLKAARKLTIDGPPGRSSSRAQRPTTRRRPG